jgi:hypothetical protein
LHQIAEKCTVLHDYIVYGYVSTDSADDNALFSALQHLRHNKHKVVLFHVVDTKTELKFDFDNTLESLSMETGETVAVFLIM